MKKVVLMACAIIGIAASLNAPAQSQNRAKTQIQPNRASYSAIGTEPSLAHYTTFQIKKRKCISAETRQAVRKRIAQHKKEITRENPNAFANEKGGHPLFIWPVQSKAGFNDYGYYTVNFLVDHDMQPGQTTDYHCGSRSYDWSTGNHQDTDIILWPYPWKYMDEEVMEVVAAAPGTITDKRDDNFDMNCSNNGAPNWNGIVIEHSDGSEAWY